MGLSWQQGPLAPGAVGRFLVPGPLPERQSVLPHGIDRNLTPEEMPHGARS